MPFLIQLESDILCEMEFLNIIDMFVANKTRKVKYNGQFYIACFFFIYFLNIYLCKIKQLLNFYLLSNTL